MVRSERASGWKSAHQLLHKELADIQRGAMKSGIEGISMFGEVGAHHVNNEINYVAQGAFAFDDSRLTTTWLIEHKLAASLGGEDAARRYLNLAKLIADHRAVASSEHVLQRARDETEDTIKQSSGDVLRRWRWLYDRLYAWQQK